MASTLKPQPVLPPMLTWLLAFGVGLSICAAGASAGAAYFAPNYWLYQLLPLADLSAVRSWLIRPVFINSLLSAAGVAALWIFTYLSCWLISIFTAEQPLTWEQHHQAQLKAVRAAAERHRRSGPTAAQIASVRQAEAEEAERRRQRMDQEILAMKLAAYNERKAKEAMAARLAQVERQVSSAYAQHAVNADFFGDTDETAQLIAFGRRLSNLGISDLGILHHSQDSRLRKAVSHTPGVRPVSADRFFKPATLESLGITSHLPLKTPFKDPFVNFNLPQPEQAFMQRFRDKFRSMRQ